MKPIWSSWPQWLTDAVISAYQSGVSVEQIGATISRSGPVVRSKLVRENVYISATTKRQTIKQEARENDTGF